MNKINNNKDKADNIIADSHHNASIAYKDAHPPLQTGTKLIF